MDITLEKVDAVKERTKVSYAEAKEALEAAKGDVLEAIIYIEQKQKEESVSGSAKECSEENTQGTETVEELKAWFKELINKGNVTRIKVSKDGKKIVDVPVNAGIAAGVIAVIIPPILAFVVVAAVVTAVTIEITKADGTVEVVNKYISQAVNVAKDKANDISGVVKEKANDISDVVKEKVSDVNIDGIKKYSSKKDDKVVEETSFTYTVNFDEEDQ